MELIGVGIEIIHGNGDIATLTVSREGAHIVSMAAIEPGARERFIAQAQAAYDAVTGL